MTLKYPLFIMALFFAGTLTANAKNPKKDSSATSYSDWAKLRVPQKSVTNGTVTVEGKKINYKAVAGTLILKNKDNQPTCSMFYVAYFKKGISDESQRPVTFIYNGGPGSSSMWLHMGAWGPQRVFLNDTTRVLPPYKTVNNNYSLLDASDLVFVDAPSTGFSRVITKKKGGVGKPKYFYSADGDGHAFADFIKDFVTTYSRWNSPKYLFGESYGTYRSAIVSAILEKNENIDLNGVILLSQILDFSNSSDMVTRNPGDILPYVLTLPTAAATAWYHHKVPNRPADLPSFLKKVQHFALNDYSLALLQGSQISSATFNKIAEKLHDFTGLPVSFIKSANLRITAPEYEKMILAKDGQITGRLDSRFKGVDIIPYNLNQLSSAYDPQSTTISSAFIASFNNYVRNVLKFGKDMKYRPVAYGITHPWDTRAGYRAGGSKRFSNVMPDLAAAMTANPKLKVMLNMGRFDFATPYFEGVYEMRHLPIAPSLRKNISFAFYQSGHMVYVKPEGLKHLHDNVAKFINDTH